MKNLANWNWLIRKTGLSFLTIMLVCFNTYALTITVTSTAASGAGTLADAINQINTAGGSGHTINFNVAANSTITPSLSDLEIDASVTGLLVDGFSNTGAACGNPNVMVTANGFGRWSLNGCSNVTIQGLRIHGGIRFEGAATGCFIYGNVFNISFAGAAMAHSASDPIRFDDNSTNNTVGGLTPCTRNIFSAEGVHCVYFDDNGTSNNIIIGNWFGTDLTGMAALGTGFTGNGLWIQDDPLNNTFDGNTVIAGGNRACYIQGGSGHVVQNNNFGTAIDGITPLGIAFALQGIFIDDSPDYIIDNNVVGRAELGIRIDGASTNGQITNNNVGAGRDRLFAAGLALTSTPISANGNAADGGLIEGNVSGNTSVNAGYPTGANIIIEDAGNDNWDIRANWVGVDTAFNVAGSSWCGIFSRGNNVTIESNYVGGNGITSAQKSHGIGTEGTSFAIVRYNLVGTTPTGGDVGNGDHGIETNGGINFSIVGNIIGFSKGLRATQGGGIGIVNGASNGTIEDNYIGVDTSGLDIGNFESGIVFAGSAWTVRSNKIAYNDDNGITLASADGADDIWMTQNCIWCNSAKGIDLECTENGGFGEIGGCPSTTMVSINPIGVGPTDSDTTGDPWIIRGVAPINAVVEVFATDMCSDCIDSAQGETYLGTVNADGAGNWTYNITAYDITTGFTATASEAGGLPKRTSEFSNCLFVFGCTPPKILTIDQQPGPLSVCQGDTVTLTATPTWGIVPCSPGGYYYSWTRGGALVQGPVESNDPYAESNIALADSGKYWKVRAEHGNNSNPMCYIEDSIMIQVNSCPPLPVELLSFTGYNQDGVNHLIWQTAEEHNNSHFEVQRSTDGSNFTSIGTVNATSLVKPINDYAFDDNDITSGKNYYYRLKQVDHDGAYTFSNIIVLNSSGSLQIDLHPNPASNIVTINVNGIDGAASLVLYDVNSKTVYSGTLTAEDPTKRLDISDLPQGVYFVKVLARGANKIAKLIISN